MAVDLIEVVAMPNRLPVREGDAVPLPSSDL